MDRAHNRLSRLLFTALILLAILGFGTGSPPPPTAAAVLPDINVLHGATFDPATSELLIFGANDPALPPIDSDDLVVALRSRFNPNAGAQDQWPGVTIEFSSTNQLLQDVFYFGPVTNTHFGAVLFEADRLLKSYSLGYDNSAGTATPINSAVPGYQSELDCLAARGYAPPAGTNIQWRKWFSPALSAQLAADGHAIVIDSSQVALSWAYDTSTHSTAVDACAGEFVTHFQAHYAEFAAEQYARGNPTLYELQQLGSMMALAEWLQDKAINAYVPGLNHDWLSRLTVAAHQTPSTTPLIAPAAGNLQIFGGVDMFVDSSNFTATAGPLPEAQAARSARPAGARRWGFTQDGQSCLVIGRKPAPTAGCPLHASIVSLEQGDAKVVSRTPHSITFSGEGGPLSPLRRGQLSGGFFGPGTASTSVDLDNPQQKQVRLYIEAAVSHKQSQSGQSALSAAGEALLIWIIPAQGEPVLLHTFTGEGREEQWTALPGFDLSAYIGQKITVMIEAQIISNSETIFYFGGLEVTASLTPEAPPTPEPSPSVDPSPSPTSSPGPSPSQSHTLRLPLIRR